MHNFIDNIFNLNASIWKKKLKEQKTDLPTVQHSHRDALARGAYDCRELDSFVSSPSELRDAQEASLNINSRRQKGRCWKCFWRKLRPRHARFILTRDVLTPRENTSSSCADLYVSYTVPRVRELHFVLDVLP